MEVLKYVARHGEGKLQAEAKRNIEYLQEIRNEPLNGLGPRNRSISSSSDGRNSEDGPENPRDLQFCVEVYSSRTRISLYVSCEWICSGS